jgi:glycine/D-amino acid oxidase-like deaminating enzyme
MKRRTFLGGLSAAAIAATAPSRHVFAADSAGPEFAVKRVAVIGAGIVGAAIAYNLSKRGCDVIIIDKRGPAAQASGNSFAWINASWYDTPASYFDLRTHSLNEYRRLAAELGFPIRWGGSLEWYHSASGESEMATGVRRIQASGAPIWMIGRERVAELEPNLELQGDPKVAWCSRDGAVYPATTTRALVDGVIANGGRAVFPATVTAIDNGGSGASIATDHESFQVDLVVVAAGIGANEVVAMAGVDKVLVKPPTPGIIVTTRPMDPLLNTVAYTTDSHFHQLPDGRVVVGEKAGPPVTNEHLAYLAGWPNTYPSAELAMQHAKRILDTASRYVPQLADADVEDMGVGWRPLPVDGLPVVGHIPESPRVYIASMHSGVTLAPIIGHLAAMEILDGVRVDLLRDFRIERL